MYIEGITLKLSGDRDFEVADAMARFWQWQLDESQAKLNNQIDKLRGYKVANDTAYQRYKEQLDNGDIGVGFGGYSPPYTDNYIERIERRKRATTTLLTTIM